MIDTRSMNRRTKIISSLVGLALASTLTACGGAVEGEVDPAAPAQSSSAPAAESTKAAPKTQAPKPAPKAKATPTLTRSQEEAIGAAEDYLASSHFSKKGLIEQLKYEGYSTKDATYAVEHIKVNWNEQAAGAAEDYLASSHFSRKGLIEQLMYEGYTKAQATYGVDKAGL
jgi:Host cell surface-exposed lipoprotein